MKVPAEFKPDFQILICATLLGTCNNYGKGNSYKYDNLKVTCIKALRILTSTGLR